jgi:hypothetical protein
MWSGRHGHAARLPVQGTGRRGGRVGRAPHCPLPSQARGLKVGVERAPRAWNASAHYHPPAAGSSHAAHAAATSCPGCPTGTLGHLREPRLGPPSGQRMAPLGHRRRDSGAPRKAPPGTSRRGRGWQRLGRRSCGHTRARGGPSHHQPPTARDRATRCMRSGAAGRAAQGRHAHQQLTWRRWPTAASGGRSGRGRTGTCLREPGEWAASQAGGPFSGPAAAGPSASLSSPQSCAPPVAEGFESSM